MKSATLLVILPVVLTACATSLRSDLADHPNGTFAEGAARRTLATAPSAPAPTVTETNATATPVTPKGAGPDAVRRGPITAADLAVVGVTADDDALGGYRGAWTPADRRLDHGDARRAFLARSPAVSEAVQRFRAAYERYGQVGALNDLVRQYDAFAGELKTGATTPAVKPHLAKRFPFGGVADLQGQLVDVDVTLARVGLERALLSEIADFEAAWQEVYYWQRAVGILADVTDLSERVVDAARARYRAGSTSHANLIQAEIRHEALSVRLTTARARRDAAKTALTAALNLPPSALDRVHLHLGGGLPDRPHRDDATAAALDHGPSVATARAARDRAALMVQLAERQLQPNLAEGATTPGSGPRPAAADLMYATGGPFLREMRVRAAATEDALTAAERRAPALAESAWVTLDDAIRRYRSAAGSQISRAEQGVEVAERGYRAGTATFFDLDNAVQLYLATALDARAALRDAHVAAARLDLIVGTGRTIPTETPDE